MTKIHCRSRTEQACSFILFRIVIIPNESKQESKALSISPHKALSVASPLQLVHPERARAGGDAGRSPDAAASKSCRRSRVFSGLRECAFFWRRSRGNPIDFTSRAAGRPRAGSLALQGVVLAPGLAAAAGLRSSGATTV